MIFGFNASLRGIADMLVHGFVMIVAICAAQDVVVVLGVVVSGHECYDNHQHSIRMHFLNILQVHSFSTNFSCSSAICFFLWSTTLDVIDASRFAIAFRPSLLVPTESKNAMSNLKN